MTRTLDEVNELIANLGTSITELNERKTALCFERDEIQDAEDKAYFESQDGKLAAGMVSLFNVPRYTWVSLSKDPKTLFFFDHIDGMYSYCLTVDNKVCHVGASTLVWTYPKLDLYRPDYEFDDEENTD